MIATWILLTQLTAAPMMSTECGVEGRERANVWERAKHPELRRYCDLLASGSAKLASGGAMAREVVGIAEEADKVLAARAAPMVLRGRALTRLGRFGEAYDAFTEAKKRDVNAVEDPVALLAYARSAARSGHADEGRTAFRALLPRASALPAAERGLVYLEAGLLSMARGVTGLDDAIVALRQARREAQDFAAAISTLALALALDRAGNKDEARAVLDERARTDAKGVTNDNRARDALGPLSLEADAMAGFGLEGTDPVLAKAAWTRYVEGSPGGPWLDHAKSHLGPVAGAKPKAR